MTGVFFLVLALLSSFSLRAMNAPKDPVLEGIFSELNKKLERIKGEDHLLIELLRAEPKSEENALTEENPNLIHAFAQYLRASPQIETLRSNLTRAIQQLPKKGLEFDRERDIEAAKFLAAILYAEESFSFLAPILSRYEQCIKINFSEAMAHNKAVSFFFLFLVNALICKEAASYLPSPEQKKSKKLSLSKSKKVKELDHRRSNLTQVAKLFQRYGATEEKLISQSALTGEIEERLSLIKSKLLCRT